MERDFLYKDTGLGRVAADCATTASWPSESALCTHWGKAVPSECLAIFQGRVHKRRGVNALLGRYLGPKLLAFRRGSIDVDLRMEGMAAREQGESAVRGFVLPCHARCGSIEKHPERRRPGNRGEPHGARMMCGERLRNKVQALPLGCMEENHAHKTTNICG